MSQVVSKLTLEEFLTLPECDERFELVAGELVPKMPPGSPHSRAQKWFLIQINTWCETSGQGEVNPEWTVVLKRNGVDWAPVPDLTYISRDRIPLNWDGEGPCPGIPVVVIEIISPGQTFAELTEKATDYLRAGGDRVWVVDLKARSVTIFSHDDLPQTVKLDGQICDPLLPGLVLSIAALFSRLA
jgi:Uma2 family endonuclease